MSVECVGGCFEALQADLQGRDRGEQCRAEQVSKQVEEGDVGKKRCGVFRCRMGNHGILEEK